MACDVALAHIQVEKEEGTERESKEVKKGRSEVEVKQRREDAFVLLFFFLTLKRR